MGISTKMLKLILVVAAIMLHVVASQPLEINVEVTVNGVKIPISQNPIAEASSGSSSGTKAGGFYPYDPAGPWLDDGHDPKRPISQNQAKTNSGSSSGTKAGGFYPYDPAGPWLDDGHDPKN